MSSPPTNREGTALPLVYFLYGLFLVMPVGENTTGLAILLGNWHEVPAAWAWLANPLLWMAVGLSHGRLWGPALVCSLAALVMALLGVIAILELTPLYTLRPGLMVWLASFAAMVFGSLISYLDRSDNRSSARHLAALGANSPVPLPARAAAVNPRTAPPPHRPRTLAATADAAPRPLQLTRCEGCRQLLPLPPLTAGEDPTDRTATCPHCGYAITIYSLSRRWSPPARFGFR